MTLLMGTLIIVLPRRFAVFPIAFITCYMTFGQELVIAGLHFTMLRVLVLFGCARFILWMEYRSFKWRRIDTLMAAWVICDTMAYSLRLHSPGALINRMGFAYDAFGLYFIFRILVRDLNDIKKTCKTFAVMLLPLAIFMSVEKMTGRNIFFVFGGVPLLTSIRDGALRCQGPFSHPILAGTFGAVWMPLFAGLWWQGKGNRLLALVGFLSSTAITILAASTGPLGTFVAGLIGLGMWRFRKHMRAVRWGILASLVGIDIIMAGHIWYIFGYMTSQQVGFEGSQGWHRSILLDAMIRHFPQWCFWGTTVRNLAEWGVHAGDITNQYVGVAVEGGLLTLILFIAIIVFSFSRFGLAIRALEQSRTAQLLVWSLGCMLFAQVITFFDVTYFDQNILNWYLVLDMVAIASVVSRPAIEPSANWAKEQMRSPVGLLGKA